MKKRKIFLCVVSVSVLINVILFLILKDKLGIVNIHSIDFESFEISIMKVAAAIAIIFKGVLSYFLRRRGNFLGVNGRIGIRVDVYHEVKDYAVAEEYKKEFFWQFCLYWFFVPFWIPFIVLNWSDLAVLLLLFCFFFIPFYAYMICDFKKDIKIGKVLKIRKQKREQELKEQMMREELGHYK